MAMSWLYCGLHRWKDPQDLLLTRVNTYDWSCIKQRVVQAEAAKRQQSLRARLASSTAWSAEQPQEQGSPAARQRVQLERQQQVRPCFHTALDLVSVLRQHQHSIRILH
jgi:hypothetical protein